MQGFVVVDSGEMLEKVHSLWKAERRWAFMLDYTQPRPTSARDLAAQGLMLPPAPGISPISKTTPLITHVF